LVSSNLAHVAELQQHSAADSTGRCDTLTCGPQIFHPTRPPGNCRAPADRHFRSAEALRAENHFLRRQLVLYIGRGVQPYRVTRISLAVLARCFDWRDAVVVVQPRTMIRWHRAGWRLLLANEVPGWSATDPEGTAYADPQDGLQRRDRALAAPRALSNIQ
jgi:hypothetical protein